MSRGSRRGCIPLKNSIIGIDDEDDCTFTLHSDGRTFHFQGGCGQWVGVVCIDRCDQIYGIVNGCVCSFITCNGSTTIPL